MKSEDTTQGHSVGPWAGPGPPSTNTPSEENFLDGLGKLIDALQGELSREEVLRVLTTDGVPATGATLGGLYLVRTDTRELVLDRTWGDPVLQPVPSTLGSSDPSPVVRSVLTGTPVVQEPGLTLEAGGPWTVGLPLRVDGQVYAVLALRFPPDRVLSPPDRTMLAVFARAGGLALDRAVVFARERIAHERMAFLADASRALAEDIDVSSTLQTLTQLAVGYFADWCGVARPHDGALRPVAIAHRDDARLALLRRALEFTPVALDAGGAAVEAFRAARTVCIPQVTPEMLLASLGDSEHLRLFEQLGLRSYLVVPLVAHGRTLGVIVFAQAESGRTFAPDDVALAEDLAQRAALALDHARLYEESAQWGAGLQRTVEERTRELEHANRELEAFAYSAAHDLRTPVRHMSGFLSLLRTSLGDRLDEKSARYLSVVDQASERMNTLIDALLGLARTAQQPLQLGLVDLNEIVALARHELEGELHGRDVVWNVQVLPTVLGDEQTLQRVVSNLLSNAVKYTRHRPRAVIDVWSKNRAEEWAVFVRDNGSGFDPRSSDRLFGLFQRLHRPEEFEGLGVGLATVRRVISRHGGRVWAEGQLGEGATFGFTLPKRH